MRVVRLDPAPIVASVGTLTPLDEGVSGFDLAHASGDSPLRLRRMDRYQALGFAAARLALSGCCERPSGKGDPEWGVILGSSLGCWGSNAQYFDDLRRGTRSDLSPALFARTVSNALNGEITIEHQIGGVNETLVSGWAAGGEALAEAGAILADGRARFVLAGGVEAPDDTLRRLHAAPLAEAAGVCLLAAPDGIRESRRPRLLAYARGHDPPGRWSLWETLHALRPLSVGTVIIANTVPPDLLRRWKEEAGGVRVVVLPEWTGEIGAAGAPVAVAMVVASADGTDAVDGVLVIARGVEGGTAALALGP